MHPNEPEFSGHGAEQPSADRDASRGARLARARREAGLTQRAVADLVGVRLWVVDQWESGTRAVPADQLDVIAKAIRRAGRSRRAGADDRESEETAAESIAAVWGQLDLTFDESCRMLDARLADVASRQAAGVQARRELDERGAALARHEAALVERERAVERRLAATETQRVELEQARTELDGRAAELGQREVALALQEQELQTAQADEQRAARERRQAEQAEMEEARRKMGERLAEIGQCLATVDEKQQQVEQRLIEVEIERSELAQGRAEVEAARRELHERAATVTDREAAAAELEEQGLKRERAQALVERAAVGRSPGEFAIDDQWRKLGERITAAAQRYEALVQKAREIKQALAGADELQVEASSAKREQESARDQARPISANVPAGQEPPADPDV